MNLVRGPLGARHSLPPGLFKGEAVIYVELVEDFLGWLHLYPALLFVQVNLAGWACCGDANS